MLEQTVLTVRPEWFVPAKMCSPLNYKCSSGRRAQSVGCTSKQTNRRARQSEEFEASVFGDPPRTKTQGRKDDKDIDNKVSRSVK